MPGLDEHRRDADRPVATHRQAAADLDEQHAPIGILAAGRLQDRAGHRAVSARLVHQQLPDPVVLTLEPQLALEHRRAREDADAAGDHPRRHALRVGVDGMKDPCRRASLDPPGCRRRMQARRGSAGRAGRLSSDTRLARNRHVHRHTCDDFSATLVQCQVRGA